MKIIKLLELGYCQVMGTDHNYGALEYVASKLKQYKKTLKKKPHAKKPTYQEITS
ncbi:MAG: hypothetical protein ACYDAJ_02350 [Nitrosotalea sp.]